MIARNFLRLSRNTSMLINGTKMNARPLPIHYWSTNNLRTFSTGPPTGGRGPPGGGSDRQGSIGGGDADGYSTEEDSKEFDNERRFSNYIMFLGSFSMAVIFLASNVVQFNR